MITGRVTKYHIMLEANLIFLPATSAIVQFYPDQHHSSECRTHAQ